MKTVRHELNKMLWLYELNPQLRASPVPSLTIWCHLQENVQKDAAGARVLQAPGWQRSEGTVAKEDF